MQIGARTGAWSGKPLPYDAEVEWLQADNSRAYIDTGIMGSSRIRIVTDFETADSTNAQWVFGQRDASSRLSSSVLIFSTTGGGAYFVWNTTNVGFAVQPLTRYLTDISNGNFNVNGVRISTTSGTFDGQFSVFLFNISLAGSRSGAGFVGKVYSCKIYDSGVLVRDYIPVRLTNESGENEGAKYDRVSGQLFRNQGTGAFVIGPDK